MLAFRDVSAQIGKESRMGTCSTLSDEWRVLYLSGRRAGVRWGQPCRRGRTVADCEFTGAGGEMDLPKS